MSSGGLVGADSAGERKLPPSSEGTDAKVWSCADRIGRGVAAGDAAEDAAARGAAAGAAAAGGAAAAAINPSAKSTPPNRRRSKRRSKQRNRNFPSRPCPSPGPERAPWTALPAGAIRESYSMEVVGPSDQGMNGRLVSKGRIVRKEDTTQRTSAKEDQQEDV